MNLKMLQMKLHVLVYLVQKVDLLQRLTKDDISNEKIKFASFKKIQINNIDIIAQRLSYVGEIGFELYIDINNSKDIFNLINDSW